MAQQREHMRVVALQKSHPEHAGYGEERAPGYREEFKGGNGSMISSSNGSAGGFAGGDAKKRRGVCSVSFQPTSLYLYTDN